MKINQKSIVLMIGMLLIFSTTTFFVQANQPKKIEVIIGFQNDIDSNLITSYKGEIQTTIHQINSVVVSIPEIAYSALQHNPKVKYIEEDNYLQFINAQTLPWGINRIDAEKVWSSYTGDGETIAIVDTGIDYDHPDLITNCLPGKSFVTGVSSWMDDNGHGTHCAGIAAALNNNFGVVGVAPDASLLPVKVLNRRGSGYTSWVSNGIIWAADNGADVISLSLSSPYYSQTLENACNYAYNTKGCVVVAAAGNGGNSAGDTDCVEYPASYDSVIAVGATTQSDSRAYFSATGPDLEVMGPGYSIYSTVWNNKYSTKSGTSMACPHVAGLAALIIDSGTTDKVQVRNKISSTAEDLGAPGFDNKFGYGLVDAEAAVGGSPPPLTCDAGGPYAGEENVAIQFSGSASGGSSPYSWSWTFGDGTTSTSQNPTHTYTTAGTYSATLTVTDSSDTCTDTTTVTVNAPPPLTCDAGGPYTGEVDVAIQFSGSASGGSGQYTWSWTFGDGTTSTSQNPTHTYTTAGTYTATLTVTDSSDTCTDTATVTVDPAPPPPPEEYMWVQSIDWSYKLAGRNIFLYHTVTVTSDDGLVTGALVYSTLSLNGKEFASFSGVTDENGQIKFTLRKASFGNYEAWVSNISHNTYEYDRNQDQGNPSYYNLD